MIATHPHRVLLDLDGRAVCARLRRRDDADSATPVVLAAGGAGRGTDGDWGPSLEESLARIGPVVAYDRAGSGHSDGPPHPRVAGMADELTQVLDAVDLREPAVLVGWSLGAFVALGSVVQRPDAVAGLVLVDPTPVEPPPGTLAVRLQLGVAKPLVAALGLASRRGAFSGRAGELVAGLMGRAGGSPDAATQALRLLRDPATLQGQVTMMELVPRYAAELEDALSSTTLPDVATTVITASRRDGVPAEYVANIERSHARLAGRFPRGEVVVAEQAGHGVPFDDPDVIVDAVRAIVAASRGA